MSVSHADFRAQVRAGKTAWAMGVYDCLTSRLAEDAGFDAVMAGGYGMSASLLGQPDAEVITLRENADIARNISAAVKIPLVVDIDTGYGNAINVQRTVAEMIRAGAAGVIIEDQISPKRCPICVEEVQIISRDEAIGKIEAANDARRGSDLLLVARTDADNEEEAIARARLYAQAGADIIQPISKTFKDYAGLKRLREGCGVPLSIQLLGWLERDLTTEQVESIAGFATHTLVSLYTVAESLKKNYAFIRQSRSARDAPVPMTTTKVFNEFIGVPSLEERQIKYLRT